MKKWMQLSPLRTTQSGHYKIMPVSEKRRDKQQDTDLPSFRDMLQQQDKGAASKLTEQRRQPSSTDDPPSASQATTPTPPPLRWHDMEWECVAILPVMERKQRAQLLTRRYSSTDTARPIQYHPGMVLAHVAKQT